MHLAYYGQLISTNNIVQQQIVFKEMTPGKYIRREKHANEKFLICHRAENLSIEFNKTWISAMLRRRNECYTKYPEHHIANIFEKYNNNSGYVARCPTEKGQVNHEAVQAFSHWTHCVTKGHLMVLDCQGAYSFFLTDPALHCTIEERFGRTSMTFLCLISAVNSFSLWCYK